MSDNIDTGFKNLHQQFLTLINPKTSSLPTPVVTDTIRFSKTLKDALIGLQNAPHDTAQIQTHYDSLIEQREKLLQNPLVQSDEKLARYIKNVIVDDGDAQSSLKATWETHVNCYNEADPVVVIPDAPKDFDKIHTQFWEYIENTQDTLKTGVQSRIESFTATLGAAMAHDSAGNTDAAIHAYNQCLEERTKLLEDPRIQQTPALLEYVSNVMADINDAQTKTSLRTTMSWHNEARDRLNTSKPNNETAEYDLVNIEDTVPLLSPEEEEAFFNGTLELEDKTEDNNVFQLFEPAPE